MATATSVYCWYDVGAKLTLGAWRQRRTATCDADQGPSLGCTPASRKIRVSRLRDHPSHANDGAEKEPSRIAMTWDGTSCRFTGQLGKSSQKGALKERLDLVDDPQADPPARDLCWPHPKKGARKFVREGA